MFTRIKDSKRIYFDKERNVMIAVFNVKNRKGTCYGSLSVTCLRGKYKEQMSLSIPDFERLKELIKRMPEITIEKK